MSHNLTGRKVLVIGGSTFPGEAIARKAAAADAQVVIAARDLSLPGGSANRLDICDESNIAAVAASTPVGRSGVNDDIADTALWLLGASFVTGETIHIEGGARF